jgi:hypothetical protein
MKKNAKSQSRQDLLCLDCDFSFFFINVYLNTTGMPCLKQSDDLLRLHLLPLPTYRTEKRIAAKPSVSPLRRLSHPYTTCSIRAKKESELCTGTFQRSSAPFIGRDLWRSGVYLLLPRDPGTEKEGSIKSGILSVTSQHTSRNVCPLPIQTVLCTKRLPLMWNSEEMLWTITLLTRWYCKSRSAPMGANTRPFVCVPRSLKYVVSLGQASLLVSQLLGEMVGLSIMPNYLYICVDVVQTNMTQPS